MWKNLFCEVLGAPAPTLTAVGARLVRLAAASARELDDSMSVCYWWQVCADNGPVLVPRWQRVPHVLLLSSLQDWDEGSAVAQRIVRILLLDTLPVPVRSLASRDQTPDGRGDGCRRCIRRLNLCIAGRWRGSGERAVPMGRGLDAGPAGGSPGLLEGRRGTGVGAADGGDQVPILPLPGPVPWRRSFDEDSHHV